MGQHTKYPKCCRLCQTFSSRFSSFKIKGKSRPNNPPPVFENILKNLIPTLPPPKCPTKKAASSARSEVLHDEMSIFLKNDVIPLFETLSSELQQRKLEFELASKFNLSKAKLIRRCDIDLSIFVAQDGHFCENCSYLLSEKQCKLFDSLPRLQETLPYDLKSTLVYIAGYVTRKDESDANNTFNYVEQCD